MSDTAAHLASLIMGFRTAQALYVAAELGLADLLRDGPRSVADLATAANAHPHPLYRLLRALASLGIFAEEQEQHFRLTPLAEHLRSDVPSSHQPRALMAGREYYQSFGQLLHCVRTGENGFQHLYGQPFFEYLAQHSDRARLFDASMVSVHGQETAAMLEVIDLVGIGTLADIGGGNGSVLTTTLQRYPALHGLLVDLPATAERARSELEAAGLGERSQIVGGSFFEPLPIRADACLLRHILHDWSDDDCLRILRNLHHVLPENGRLLVVEFVLPPGNEPSPGKLLDLTMLVLLGGQERTLPEYETLLQAGGFRLERVTLTRTEVSVLEARKASDEQVEAGSEGLSCCS